MIKEIFEIEAELDRELNRKRFNFAADRKNTQKFIEVHKIGETIAMLPKHRGGA